MLPPAGGPPPGLSAPPPLSSSMVNFHVSILALQPRSEARGLASVLRFEQGFIVAQMTACFGVESRNFGALNERLGSTGDPSPTAPDPCHRHTCAARRSAPCHSENQM